MTHRLVKRRTAKDRRPGCRNVDRVPDLECMPCPCRPLPCDGTCEASEQAQRANDESEEQP